MGLVSCVHYLTGQRSIYVHSCAHAYPHSSEWEDNLQLTHMGMAMLICWETLNRFPNYREFSKSQVTQLHPNYIKESCRVVSLRANCILLFYPSITDIIWKHLLSVGPLQCFLFYSFFNFHNYCQEFIWVAIFSYLSLYTDWLLVPSKDISLTVRQ